MLEYIDVTVTPYQRIGSLPNDGELCHAISDSDFDGKRALERNPGLAGEYGVGSLAVVRTGLGQDSESQCPWESPE